MDGTPWSFENWKVGEPNGGDGDDCVVQSPTGGWNDIGCTGTKNIVCQKGL